MWQAYLMSTLTLPSLTGPKVLRPLAHEEVDKLGAENLLCFIESRFNSSWKKWPNI